jgi:hypothetical protein
MIPKLVPLLHERGLVMAIGCTTYGVADVLQLVPISIDTKLGGCI